MIVSGRRRPAPLSWRRIGEALGVSGQAAGQRAQARHLHVQCPDRERLLEQGRELAYRLGRRY
jgi:hypothetical protein